MKGIKGERKCYGMHSPLHKLFIAHKVPYAGTRGTNGYQKAPWYIYETEAGKPADIEEMAKAMLGAGYELDKGIECEDGSYIHGGFEPKKQPETGSCYRPKGKTYVSYTFRKHTPGRIDSVQIVNYTHEGKPEKNDTHINHIVYLG